MMNNLKYIYIVFILLLLSINSKSQDLEKIQQISDFDILDQTIKLDTLKIVSTSEFLYYPFGVYKSETEFHNKYRYMKKTRITAPLQPLIFVWNFTFKESFIKIFISEETRKSEILRAKIKDKEIALENGIVIGMKGSIFFNTFGVKLNDSQISQIKVVELQSGLLGIWHYYDFENESLVSIKINSDYQF